MFFTNQKLSSKPKQNNAKNFALRQITTDVRAVDFTFFNKSLTYDVRSVTTLFMVHCTRVPITLLFCNWINANCEWTGNVYSPTRVRITSRPMTDCGKKSAIHDFKTSSCQLTLGFVVGILSSRLSSVQRLSNSYRLRKHSKFKFQQGYRYDLTMN